MIGIGLILVSIPIFASYIVFMFYPPNIGIGGFPYMIMLNGTGRNPEFFKSLGEDHNIIEVNAHSFKI